MADNGNRPGTIVLGDVTLRFEPLTLGQVRKYFHLLDSAQTGARWGLKEMTEAMPMVLECLLANHPDLKLEYLEQIVNVRNFPEVLRALMEASGSRGEAKPVEAT